MALLATLFSFLTASAQGEWKWAHCWNSTRPNDDEVNTVKNVDFDDEGNIYVLGSMGGNLTVDGYTFLFLNNPTVYYNADYSAFIMKTANPKGSKSSSAYGWSLVLLGHF